MSKQGTGERNGSRIESEEVQVGEKSSAGEASGSYMFEQFRVPRGGCLGYAVADPEIASPTPKRAPEKRATIILLIMIS